MTNTKKRDAAADLVKCIGCLLVVLQHVQTPLQTGKGALTIIHLFVSGLCADGVMVFFAAAGFFMFRDRNILRRYRRSFISVYIPGIAALLFYMAAHRWMAGETGLIGSIAGTRPGDLKALAFELLHWSVPSYAGHLWYLAEYLKCLILYPLLMFVCTQEREAVIVRRGILILGFLWLLIRDTGVIGLSPMKHIAPFQATTTPAMMMLAGYELRQFRENRLSGKFHAGVLIMGIALYLLPNIARIWMQLRLWSFEPDNNWFLNWETAAGALAAAGIILVVFSLPVKREGPAGRAALIIGPCTYGVYLIHVCVVNRMDRFGLRDRLIALLNAYESPAGYVCTVLITCLFVFSLCVLLILLWHSVKTIIMSVCSKRTGQS